MRHTMLTSSGKIASILATFLILALEQSSHVSGNELPRVRGIPLSKSSLYNPDRDFECLDGSRLMRFERVNDDYCDCGDGSDEPGTPACPNGVFFCQNNGHVSRYLPSSRVNDGMCDCCDASDEYSSDVECRNTCHDLGKEARREAEKAAELLKEGNKIRLEMMAAGKRLKAENQAGLVKLRTDFNEATLTKKEKEALKKVKEERESAALEKYKPAEPEPPVETAADEAKEYFKLLDSDGNGILTVDELRARATFDTDRNGEVSEEEAMLFFNNEQEINEEQFVETSWPLVKPFLMKEQGSFKLPSQKAEREVAEDHEDSPDHPVEEDIETDPEGDGDFDATEDDDDHEGEEQQPESQQEKEPEVRYDEETQALIDEANQAREQFQQASKAWLDLQTEIQRIEEKIERDYGPDEEFSSLDGECFEYRDLEYVYALCLFGRATQRSVSGGSEVNLGHFHEWAGAEHNKYSKMKYDRGLTCWNGPARNTLVNLRCGIENRLISVSEPSRCEYTMEFTTPALCNPENDKREAHDEL